MTREELINSQEYKDAKKEILEYNKDIDFLKEQLRHFIYSSILDEDKFAKKIADYFYEKYDVVE